MITGRTRVSMCLPYEIFSLVRVTQIQSSSYSLQLSSSVSPPSTRCPDMAAVPDRSSILPRIESPWRPPCVYDVSRRIPRRLNTKIPRPLSASCTRERSLYGEALAAPYIIERCPEAFHPRPACLPDHAGPHCPGFVFPTWKRSSVGAKVVGSLTPEVTGAPALDRIDRSPAIRGYSMSWTLKVYRSLDCVVGKSLAIQNSLFWKFEYYK